MAMFSIKAVSKLYLKITRLSNEATFYFRAVALQQNTRVPLQSILCTVSTSICLKIPDRPLIHNRGNTKIQICIIYRKRRGLDLDKRSTT